MQKQNNGMSNVVFTGGHAGSTAYALIEEIHKRKLKLNIFWFGARYAIEGKNVETYESKVLPSLGIKFIALISGRLQTKFSIWTIPSLVKIPVSFIQAFFLLVQVKPRLVVSFGGFSSFPVVVGAWILGYPIIIHEQTSVFGRANKLAAFFATKIALARTESNQYFPKNKSVVIGNPIADKIRNSQVKVNLSSPPVLLVTGGSRGSVTINRILEQCLRKLLDDYVIIHQAGKANEARYLKVRNSLPSELRKKYQVYGLLMPDVWYRMLASADIVISRAGANTVSEIIALKRPSILIPLPIAYMQEQRENAVFAKKFGIAEIIEEIDLTPSLFLATIGKLRKNWHIYLGASLKKESPDFNAAKKFADLITQYL